MTIKEYIVEELQKEYSISEDLNIDELDFISKGYISSLGLIQFIVMLEDEFGIEFSDEELGSDDFRKVGTLVAMIERKMNAL